MTGVEYLQNFEPWKALPLLKKDVERNPGYGERINYATALRGCGKIEAAITTLSLARAQEPERPEAWNNLGQCFEDLGKFQEAPHFFQEALKRIEKSGTPIHSAKEPLLGFAHALMRLGQFKSSWPLWEAARFGLSWHPFPGVNRWLGETGEQVRLLVVPEGGFGDGISFLRWIPRIPVGRIAIIIWDHLWEMARHALRDQPHVTVDPISKQWPYEELATFTHCTPYLSLMNGMQQWSDIPPALNWIPAHTIEAPPNDWIGFCWRAEENGVMRKIRTFDQQAASRVAKMLNSHCEAVVSLSPAGKELYRQGDNALPKGVIEKPINSWEDTARLILRCKAVVTVDTAVAHLAGSLGVPTLVLLPLRSDWKWGLPPATKTAWYGLNLRVFRNPHPTDWDTDRIREAFEKL